MTSTRERELVTAQAAASAEYIASMPGAYQPGAGRTAADRRYCIAARAYNETSAALIAYRRSVR